MQPTGRPNPSGAAGRSRSPSPDNQRGAVGGGQAAASLTGGGADSGLPPTAPVRPTNMQGQPPLATGGHAQEPQGAAGGSDLPQLMAGLRVRDARDQSGTVASSVGSRARGEYEDRPSAANATALRNMNPVKLSGFLYKGENLRFVMGDPHKQDLVVLFFQDRNGFTGRCSVPSLESGESPEFTKPDTNVSTLLFLPKPEYADKLGSNCKTCVEATGYSPSLDQFRVLADNFRAEYEPKEGYTPCLSTLNEDDEVTDTRILGSAGYNMEVLGYDALDSFKPIAADLWREYLESRAERKAAARPVERPEERRGSGSGSDDTAL